MTIEFLDGTISGEQHRVPEHMRSLVLETLEDGESCLTTDEAFWMDANGMLWIDEQAPSYGLDTYTGDISDYIRIMKLPVGYVVDISHARKDWVDDVTDDVRLPYQTGPSYQVDGYTCIPKPIIGFISNEFERNMFEGIVDRQYGYSYPELGIKPYEP